MSDALRVHVRKILRSYAADHEAEAAKIREIEASGGLVIGGGQLWADEWEITDWRTGARLATGTDGMSGYNAALKRLDPPERWRHIDQVSNGIGEFNEPATDGIPPSLAIALSDWIGTTSTPAAEIGEVAGWDAAEVKRCLERTAALADS